VTLGALPSPQPISPHRKEFAARALDSQQGQLTRVTDFA